MQGMVRTLLLLALWAVPCMASAQALHGVLQLQWGDAPAAGVAPVRVQVATAAGDHELDARQSLHAATDLYALNGRQVSVVLDGARKSSGAALPASIVPVAGKAVTDALPVVEDRPWVVLLCKFADIPGEPRHPAQFRALFGYEEGQLGAYFDRMSDGQAQLREAQVHGWHALPQPRSAYFTSRGGAALNRLMDDCIGVADADVDFDSGIAGILLMFNAPLDGYAWAGSAYRALDGETRAWRVAWLPPAAQDNVATLAHEIGHTFGLPHSNNADGDTDTYDSPWDLMSDPHGYARHDPVLGRLPKSLAAHQRDRLGWIAPARRRVLDHEGIHQVLVVPSDGGTADDAELLELHWGHYSGSRRLVLSAASVATPPDAALPGSAVIVHELDDTRREPGWTMDAGAVAADYADTPANMFEPGEHWRSADGAIAMQVLARTADGFLLQVELRRPIFSDRFGD